MISNQKCVTSITLLWLDRRPAGIARCGTLNGSEYTMPSFPQMIGDVDDHALVTMHAPAIQQRRFD